MRWLQQDANMRTGGSPSRAAGKSQQIINY
jgi:hypothetical protein